jgi:hypothetical protein
MGDTTAIRLSGRRRHRPLNACMLRPAGAPRGPKE